LEGNLIDEAEVAAALADFHTVWDCLAPREQARIVELLVEQVVYDHAPGSVAIAFRETGIKTLAAELAAREEKAA
jgi:site-specific DNA recombinase